MSYISDSNVYRTFHPKLSKNSGRLRTRRELKGPASEFANRETASESRLRLLQKRLTAKQVLAGFRIAEKIDNSCISTSLSRGGGEGEKERGVTKEPM